MGRGVGGGGVGGCGGVEGVVRSNLADIDDAMRANARNHDSSEAR